MKLKPPIIFLLLLLLNPYYLILTTPSFAQEKLTLEESVRLGLKTNPSVIASQKKVEAAEARLRQAVGAFFPTVKLDGNYGKAYTQPSTVQITMPTTLGAVTQTYTFGTDATSDTKGWTASLSQPLFVAALWPGFQIAQKNVALAKADLRQITLETSFNITQAYFAVLMAEKLVKLSEQSVEMARYHFNQVKFMVSAGTATRSDLLRTEVQLVNSEVALTKAKNALEIARDAFNNALGRNLAAEVKIAEEDLSAKIISLPDYAGLLKLAFENRPDWKQFILSREIAEENVGLAQTAYLPTVLLSGQTGNRITEYPAYRSDVNSWSVTGIASWTLFDGLGTQNRIWEAAANLEAQKATEEQVKNGIALEVRNAYLNLKSILEVVGSAKKALESAEENYKVSEQRYRAGVGTNLEVIDAQVALTQARINYFQSQFDLIIAQAKINKVVGKEVI